MNVLECIVYQIRPTLRSRIGTSENQNGAIGFLNEKNANSPSGGQMALAMFIEAVEFVSSQIPLPYDLWNKAVADEVCIDGIRNICFQANDTHSKGKSAGLGALLGYGFGGIFGAAVGALGGVFVSQYASNKDMSAITAYARQAADYFCDRMSAIATIAAQKNELVYYYKEDEQKSEQIEHSKHSKSDYPKFNDVIGLEEAKQEIREKVIKPAKHPDIYKKYGYQAGGGILLYGLPGTGKTMFAQAVANELDGKFISIKASDIKSKYYGETEGKIKELFEEARKEKVSVIFIDEFEAIGIDRNKSDNDLTGTAVVPELLAQMQGFEKNGDNILLVIAATNRPWDIDTALLRPGRLDCRVYVDLPNKECRLAMIRNNLKKISISETAINMLAEETAMYNGSDIKNICDFLKTIVINKEIEGYNCKLGQCDVAQALAKIHSSVSQRDVELMKIFKSSKF